MQVLCQATNHNSDVRCDVCGQAFRVYYTRTSAHAYAEALASVMVELGSHHIGLDTKAAHPELEFRLPDRRAVDRTPLPPVAPVPPAIFLGYS